MKSSLLIVDDSPHFHKMVRAYLEPESLAIHSAQDGEAALSMAAQLRPGLVLLDVDMPQLDGFEVCRRLKANAATTTVPIIFVTADISLSDKVKGLDLGAADYITKPFKPEELRARVRSALRTKHKLDKTSMVEGLSGLWNRAYLELHLPAQLSLSRRTGQPLACVIGDIDYLGRLNEQHGQSTGDEILRAVAHIHLSQSRAEDTICHFGGGKFVALIPGATQAAAAHFADRVRGEVQRQLLKRGAVDTAVTCSFGVADTHSQSDASLLDRADAALFRAKQAGRNSVSLSRPAADATMAA